jgi:hypothetical protein
MESFYDHVNTDYSFNFRRLVRASGVDSAAFRRFNMTQERLSGDG